MQGVMKNKVKKEVKGASVGLRHSGKEELEGEEE